MLARSFELVQKGVLHPGIKRELNHMAGTQLPVETKFEAGQSAAVGIHLAQHLHGCSALRVEPLDGRIEFEAGQT